MHSTSVCIEDFVVCVTAHTRLANYDDALELVNVALQAVDQFDGCDRLEAEIQLLFQHAQLMTLQHRWLDAKEDLEACLSSSYMLPAASDVLWNAAAALATATAKCGDAFAGEKILREACAMAVTAYGSHGIPTLNMQHFLANFLWEACATSAQKNEAEALIIRTVESKRLLLGCHHSSTIVSMQLMCQILSQTSRNSLCESALLDLLSSCLNFRGWLHIETIDALYQLGSFYYKLLEAERAELLYLVGFCLLDYISCERAVVLASETQQCLLQLYHATAQSDKTSLMRALISHKNNQLHELNANLVSRNFPVEDVQESAHPHFITQFFQKRISELKRSLSSNHPADSLVRLSEAIHSQAMGQHEHARALFSSCVAQMGSSWWHHPDCPFIAISLAQSMIASSDFESSVALLTQASSRAQERQPYVSIKIMLSAVDMFEKSHKSELAVEFLQRAVVLQSLHFGPVSASTLSSQHLLADLHVASGAFTSAESIMWDAFESCQASLGPSHETTIEWLEELCNLYALMQNISKASFIADVLLNSSLNCFGETDVRTLAAMDRRARFFRLSGELDEAKKLYEHCLQLRILFQGDDASATHATRTALAEVQTLLLPQLREREMAARGRRMRELEDAAFQALRADDIEGALPILASRYEMTKDSFGLHCVSTARAAASYGCVLLQMKQFQTSHGILQQAVGILQQKLGPSSKEALVSASAFAKALVGIGDFQHAEEILINCLDECDRSCSDDNLYMTFVLQLGCLFSTIDSKLQLARALLQECLSYFLKKPQQKELSEDRNFKCLDTLDNLADVLVKLNDLNAAETCLQQAVKFSIQLYGSSHESTIQASSRLANFFVQINKPQEALPLLQYVLDMRFKQLGSKSHEALCTAEDLSGVYQSLLHLYFADVLLSLSITQRNSASTSAPSDLVSILMRRAIVLQQAGKYESALRCFLECLERQCNDADQYDSVAFKAAEHSGFCMMKIGLLQHARVMFSHCMQVLNKSRTNSNGAVDRHKYFCLGNLGTVAASEGRFSDAENHFVACLSFLSSSTSTEDAIHVDHADVTWNLAIVYQKAGKFLQAESLLLKCIQTHELNNDTSKLMCAKHSLALLYW